MVGLIFCRLENVYLRQFFDEKEARIPKIQKMALESPVIEERKEGQPRCSSNEREIVVKFGFSFLLSRGNSTFCLTAEAVVDVAVVVDGVTSG